MHVSLIKNTKNLKKMIHGLEFFKQALTIEEIVNPILKIVTNKIKTEHISENTKRNAVPTVSNLPQSRALTKNLRNRRMRLSRRR